MSKLFIVGSPIGNIEDVTLRQLRVIFTTPYIFAEDTRNFKKLKSILLERYAEVLNSLSVEILHDQFLFSYREHNHKKVAPQIIEFIQNGHDVALFSDAGMPGISDPGSELIRDAFESGVEVEIIPSTTSIEPALLLSGLPTDKFAFIGFLPRTRSKIIKLINAYDVERTTVVFFESPYRVIKTLEAIQTEFGDEIKVSVSNDITKKFEKTFRGNIGAVIESLKKIKVQGEWVVCVRM